MLTFALHRQGQDCQACTRPRHGLPRFNAGPPTKEAQQDYRRPELNLQPFTDARTVFLAAPNDWVCPSEQMNPLRPRARHA